MRHLWLIFLTLYCLTMVAVAGLGPEPPLLSAAALTGPMVWLSVTDVRAFIIPDTAVVAIAAIGFLHWATTDSETLLMLVPLSAGLLGTAWAFGEIYFRRVGRDGFGMGDAKLLAAGALCVAPAQIWMAVLLAATGGAVSTLMQDRKLVSLRGSGVPFGPYLAYAFFLVHLLSFPRWP